MKNEGEARDAGVLSNPLSFLRSGYFYWLYGDLNGRGGSGYYWTLRSHDITASNFAYINDAALYSQNDYDRGRGLAVRCKVSSKSFTTLINTSYSMKNSTQTSETDQDSGILSNPLSFVHSGNFYWGTARLDVRDIGGRYWSLHSQSTEGRYSLYFQNTALYPQTSNNSGVGFAVRPSKML